mgnify:CR=1 FL=1|jgi:putative addiction module component (TIGR02574 family)
MRPENPGVMWRFAVRSHGQPAYTGHMKRDDLTVEEQATRLPHRDRARLALRLLESLDPGQDENVDELWLDEAERRLREYEQGGTTARDAEDALADIERRLK